uniref:Uncharacterized protein n=1 Tax=Solanum lycopersicum TaxID=4081 RepID=A0A3Q7IUE0_SOLLC
MDFEIKSAHTHIDLRLIKKIVPWTDLYLSKLFSFDVSVIFLTKLLTSWSLPDRSCYKLSRCCFVRKRVFSLYTGEQLLCFLSIDRSSYSQAEQHQLFTLLFHPTAPSLI